jgi:DNA-binding Xre family transcriptional regulator
MKKITIEITLNEDTVSEIDEYIHFGKFKSEFVTTDIPINHEEFIKSAVNYYLKRLAKFKKLVDETHMGKLGKTYKLRNKFKEVMKKKRMKAIELSEKTGIDKANISMILNNRNQPSLDYFLRIWVALEYPPLEEVFYRD